MMRRSQIGFVTFSWSSFIIDRHTVAMKKKSTYIHHLQRVCGRCKQIMACMEWALEQLTEHLTESVGLDGAVSDINVLSDFVLK